MSIDPSKLFNFGVLLNICLRLGPSPSVPFDIRDPNEMTVSSLSASIIASRGRDIERRAKRHDLPWSGIPPYPIKHLPFANRIALIGAKEGWCAQYTKAAYQRWFVKGQDPGIEPDLSGALQDIGQNPGWVIAAAASEEIKAALNSETDAARALGIFGSPTFVSEE